MIIEYKQKVNGHYCNPKMSIFSAICILLFLSACTDETESIRAGVAVMDITPPLSIKPILGGYGDRMSKPAEGIHDRIFTKALVLKDQEQKFVIITADLQSFPPYFKPILVEALENNGWTRDQIMLLPSHSHSSIEMMSFHIYNNLNNPRIGIFNQDVLTFLIDQFKNVVLNAEKNMQTVKAGTIRKELLGWNRNRREGNSTIDPDLTITRIDNMKNEPLAVLINWTAHPTFMGPNDMEFSGGWPGHLQRTIEALYDNHVTVMYYNGAEGDQSPVPRLSTGSHWEQTEAYGRDLGILSWRLAQNIPTKIVTNIQSNSIDISLPNRTWHPDFLKTGGAEYGINDETAGYIIHRLFPEKTSSISVIIGDLQIIGIPGEMAAGLGKEIKQTVANNIGVPFVTIGGLANEWISYMLTANEYNKGGYESSVSFYGPTLGKLMVNSAMKGATK